MRCRGEISARVRKYVCMCAGYIYTYRGVTVFRKEGERRDCLRAGWCTYMEILRGPLMHELRRGEMPWMDGGNYGRA